MQFGGTLLDAKLQLLIQGFGSTVGYPQVLDKIVVLKAQVQRGLDGAIETPGGGDRGSSEQGSQKSHRAVFHVGLEHEPYGREQTTGSSRI